MQMIVASRLGDGRVVFLADGARWVEAIDTGLIADSAESAAELLAIGQAAVDRCQVVDPYVIDIVVEGGRRRPAVLREAIRAFGPSIAAEPGSIGS
jgi:hypothetical protein